MAAEAEGCDLLVARRRGREKRAKAREEERERNGNKNLISAHRKQQNGGEGGKGGGRGGFIFRRGADERFYFLHQ